MDETTTTPCATCGNNPCTCSEQATPETAAPEAATEAPAEASSEEADA